jgi:hypothetical protein
LRKQHGRAPTNATHLTRRRFTLTAAATLGTAAGFPASRLPAQSAHASVATMERPRVLADAPAALTAQPKTLRDFSTTIACLTAAFLLTQDKIYANRAAELLNTWLIAPTTRLPAEPSASVVDLVPLAEAARATSFLVDTLPPATLAATNAWFAALFAWLNTAREPQIARDSKDHRASAWLLLAAAIARGQQTGSQADEKDLDDLRHRFRTPTLRNQIRSDGSFPQEVATPNPYRNTLFNFDLLAGACQLLSSPFDDLWDYELPDGPGMRSVAAFFYPLIQDPTKWPWPADAEHFRELPGRRPALLFSGRAYDRAEYVALWQSLPPEIPPDLAANFPIRQPLLWTTRAPHGL